MFRSCLTCLWLLLVIPAATAFGQQRTVAITVDDLPYAGADFQGSTVPERVAAAEAVNRSLLAAFRKHGVPVTGFVNQKTVDDLGPQGSMILREWIRGGFDLGNHMYSHADVKDLPEAQIEDEIVRGESAIAPLMREAGKQLAFFRFPFNDTGDTKQKHDSIAAFLAGRGYSLATCTIDSSDYLFNDAYVLANAKNDSEAIQKLRAAYVAYSATEIDYYTGLNRQVFGYEPPEVMLLHANRLNAEFIDEILRLFEDRKYRFVSLRQAQADAAYRTPDTFITKFGPMWGYRWAKERNVKVDGSLEQEPPAWVLQYGKAR